MIPGAELAAAGRQDERTFGLDPSRCPVLIAKCRTLPPEQLSQYLTSTEKSDA
ncbi:hypothetical protein SEA_POPPER_58 [Arthrobacter phage Popper]|uniref:Uncharacterized protein n=1 Tax=Arthrobacter phage Popper TaxID=2859633 RepID=A0AAE7WDT6_9CAUD|nr:hypothetical protein QEO78_gp48 [Arthrobacter phage Popper]QYC54975.1 hypothetical protein SEA_POPPER_58 [Arthrobacter phage Popper]